MVYSEARQIGCTRPDIQRDHGIHARGYAIREIGKQGRGRLENSSHCSGLFEVWRPRPRREHLRHTFDGKCAVQYILVFLIRNREGGYKQFRNKPKTGIMLGLNPMRKYISEFPNSFIRIRIELPD